MMKVKITPCSTLTRNAWNAISTMPATGKLPLVSSAMLPVVSRLDLKSMVNRGNQAMGRASRMPRGNAFQPFTSACCVRLEAKMMMVNSSAIADMLCLRVRSASQMLCSSRACLADQELTARASASATRSGAERVSAASSQGPSTDGMAFIALRQRRDHTKLNCLEEVGIRCRNAARLICCASMSSVGAAQLTMRSEFDSSRVNSPV
mmetsp:Transcript_23134/g.74418  ORF Transcript_23134/g.74418 Transcript_23134/m.74418 type:complete len:207 (-) Transcript_23134:390-1010(-)